MTSQPAPAADPFDLDFDGETEFATPQTSGAADPSDPFAGLSAPMDADEEDGDVHASANPIAEMLASAEAALGITPDDTSDSRSVLRDYGNMSSTTITFILDRMRRRNAPRPCVALAFGPGLTVEAILFR